MFQESGTTNWSRTPPLLFDTRSAPAMYMEAMVGCPSAATVQRATVSMETTSSVPLNTAAVAGDTSKQTEVSSQDHRSSELRLPKLDTEFDRLMAHAPPLAPVYVEHVSHTSELLNDTAARTSGLDSNWPVKYKAPKSRGLQLYLTGPRQLDVEPTLVSSFLRLLQHVPSFVCRCFRAHGRQPDSVYSILHTIFSRTNADCSSAWRVLVQFPDFHAMALSSDLDELLFRTPIAIPWLTPHLSVEERYLLTCMRCNLESAAAYSGGSDRLCYNIDIDVQALSTRPTKRNRVRDIEAEAHEIHPDVLDERLETQSLPVLIDSALSSSVSQRCAHCGSVVSHKRATHIGAAHGACVIVRLRYSCTEGGATPVPITLPASGYVRVNDDRYLRVLGTVNSDLAERSFFYEHLDPSDSQGFSDDGLVAPHAPSHGTQQEHHLIHLVLLEATTPPYLPQPEPPSPFRRVVPSFAETVIRSSSPLRHRRPRRQSVAVTVVSDVSRGGSQKLCPTGGEDPRLLARSDAALLHQLVKSSAVDDHTLHLEAPPSSKANGISNDLISTLDFPGIDLATSNATAANPTVNATTITPEAMVWESDYGGCPGGHEALTHMSDADSEVAVERDRQDATIYQLTADETTDNRYLVDVIHNRYRSLNNYQLVEENESARGAHQNLQQYTFGPRDQLQLRQFTCIPEGKFSSVAILLLAFVPFAPVAAAVTLVHSALENYSHVPQLTLAIDRTNSNTARIQCFLCSFVAPLATLPGQQEIVANVASTSLDHMLKHLKSRRHLKHLNYITGRLVSLVATYRPATPPSAFSRPRRLIHAAVHHIVADSASFVQAVSSDPPPTAVPPAGLSVIASGTGEEANEVHSGSHLGLAGGSEVHLNSSTSTANQQRISMDVDGSVGTATVACCGLWESEFDCLKHDGQKIGTPPLKTHWNNQRAKFDCACNCLTYDAWSAKHPARLDELRKSAASCSRGFYSAKRVTLPHGDTVPGAIFAANCKGICLRTAAGFRCGACGALEQDECLRRMVGRRENRGNAIPYYPGETRRGEVGMRMDYLTPAEKDVAIRRLENTQHDQERQVQSLLRQTDAARTFEYRQRQSKKLLALVEHHNDGDLIREILAMLKAAVEVPRRFPVQIALIGNMLQQMTAAPHGERYSSLVHSLVNVLRSSLGKYHYFVLEQLFFLPSLATARRQLQSTPYVRLGLNPSAVGLAKRRFTTDLCILSIDAVRCQRGLDLAKVDGAHYLVGCAPSWKEFLISDPTRRNWDTTHALLPIPTPTGEQDQYTAVFEFVQQLCKSRDGKHTGLAAHASLTIVTSLMRKASPVIVAFYPEPTSGYDGTVQTHLLEAQLRAHLAQGLCMAGFSNDSASHYLRTSENWATPQAQPRMYYIGLSKREPLYAPVFSSNSAVIAYCDWPHWQRLMYAVLGYATRELNFFVCSEHKVSATKSDLHRLVRTIGNDRAHFTHADLKLGMFKDGSNAADRVFSRRTEELLGSCVPGSEGTCLYIRMVRSLTEPMRYGSQLGDPLYQVTSVFRAMGIAKLWLASLELQQLSRRAGKDAANHPRRKGNFITDEAFRTMTIIGHSVVLHHLNFFLTCAHRGWRASTIQYANTLPLEYMIGVLQGKGNKIRSAWLVPTVLELLRRLRTLQASVDGLLAIEEASEGTIALDFAGSHARKEDEAYRVTPSSESKYEYPSTYREFRATLLQAKAVGLREARDCIRRYCPAMEAVLVKGLVNELTVLDTDHRVAFNLFDGDSYEDLPVDYDSVCSTISLAPDHTETAEERTFREAEEQEAEIAEAERELCEEGALPLLLHTAASTTNVSSSGPEAAVDVLPAPGVHPSQERTQAWCSQACSIPDDLDLDSQSKKPTSSLADAPKGRKGGAAPKKSLVKQFPYYLEKKLPSPVMIAIESTIAAATGKKDFISADRGRRHRVCNEMADHTELPPSHELVVGRFYEVVETAAKRSGASWIGELVDISCRSGGRSVKSGALGDKCWLSFVTVSVTNHESFEQSAKPMRKSFLKPWEVTEVWLRQDKSTGAWQSCSKPETELALRTSRLGQPLSALALASGTCMMPESTSDSGVPGAAEKDVQSILNRRKCHATQLELEYLVLLRTGAKEWWCRSDLIEQGYENLVERSDRVMRRHQQNKRPGGRISQPRIAKGDIPLSVPDVAKQLSTPVTMEVEEPDGSSSTSVNFKAVLGSVPVPLTKSTASQSPAVSRVSSCLSKSISATSTVTSNSFSKCSGETPPLLASLAVPAISIAPSGWLTDEVSVFMFSELCLQC